MENSATLNPGKVGPEKFSDIRPNVLFGDGSFTVCNGERNVRASKIRRDDRRRIFRNSHPIPFRAGAKDRTMAEAAAESICGGGGLAR